MKKIILFNGTEFRAVYYDFSADFPAISCRFIEEGPGYTDENACNAADDAYNEKMLALIDSEPQTPVRFGEYEYLRREDCTPDDFAYVAQFVEDMLQ